MQKLLEVEKRAAKHGAAVVSIQAVVRAAVAQNSGSAEPCSACQIFEYPLNFYRDVWDVIDRYVSSRYSESRLVRKNIEFERYISCHCFYLKTKFQINWAGSRGLGKRGALQACWRIANAIWLQSCYFIVLLCNREFVLRTVLHRKKFCQSLNDIEIFRACVFALLSHVCLLVFWHTGQAAPRKVLSAYKSDGAY